MNFSVIGSKVDTSLSPEIHTWIYNKLNLKHGYGYIKLSENFVGNIVDKIKENNLDGANITMPFKESIVKDIDELDEISSRIGAVNCIASSDNHIKGYNTDVYGFQKLIDINKVDLNNKNILLLGSGGGSRAVLTLLKDLSLDFSIFNRTKENLEQMIVDLSLSPMGSFTKSDQILNSKINMIINCLPYEVNYGLILKQLLPDINGFDTIIDINYAPISWEVRSEYFINGLDMLLFQAIKSNEIWMNKNILKDVDYYSLRSYVQGKN